jgi:FkbM family methyltransferase
MVVQTYGVKVPKTGVGFEFQLDLDPNDHSTEWIARHFQVGVCYEQEVAQVMLRVLRPGDVAIDVGANAGFFTVLMSKLVGPEGRVLAFEPGRNTLPALKRSLALNTPFTDNVGVIEKPLWNCVEVRTFYHSADGSGGNALWDPGLWGENSRTRECPDSFEVETTALDKVYGLNQPVRLIKIDTEGAEQNILEGADRLLCSAYAPPFIIVEFNPFGAKQFGHTSRTLRDYMKSYGYDTFLLRRDGDVPCLVPPRSELLHIDDCVVFNGMFSTIEAVGEMWPMVYGSGS